MMLPCPMPHRARNILVIIADQLAQRAVGAYGDPWARTPHLDRLARDGVRFANAYTPCPLCLPARAAYWTGRWPHQTGVISNGRRLPVPRIPDTWPTLGSLFSAAGYQCVHFGKTHDAGALRGFHHIAGGMIPDPPFPPHLGANDDTFRDRHTTREAVSFLRDSLHPPFLLAVDFNNPHNICGYVGANRGPHEDLPIPGPLPELPPNFEITDLDRRPRPIQYLCCSHNRLAQAARWSPENYRHYLAAYTFYLEMVDAQIGAILDALETSGHRDDTLVLFFADHGDGLTSHRMVTKQVSFYEEVTRVPLIVSGPGVAGANRVVARPLVSLLDLVPTLCDWAGLETPGGLAGYSLRPWLEGRDPDSPRDYVLAEWYSEWGYTISPGRMLRTARYKYTRYLEGDGEELYDLEADPGETRTLIGDPAHALALADHRTRLASVLRSTDDPFFLYEVRVDPRWRSHPLGYFNHEGPAAPEWTDQQERLPHAE